MDLIFNFFNQGWVGAVIGILGVLIALYTYKIAKIGPRLVYQWESFEIIGKNEVTPDEIEIFFKGKKVPRVIKTTTVIWNSGTETIHGENIVKNDSLQLEFDDEKEIIGASILLRTKEVNGFEISTNDEKKNILNMKFEYLDRGDGVTIEILHTDENRYPNFKGTIKGMPNGMKNWGNKSRLNKRSLRKIKPILDIYVNVFPWITLVFGILFICSSIIITFFFFRDYEKSKSAKSRHCNNYIYLHFRVDLYGFIMVSVKRKTKKISQIS
ncbi:hypothetical protein M5J14_08180 [Lysinibacillus sp. OL1_EC]|uniref:hypothetical protein n=1 Tax=unclassified Lysinibacillus TaxID=2636778 RepID=UPI00103CFA8D|nr:MULTISPECIES: hypothetical protein [unclassified Lysinibacillus]MCM0624503.1 hypothetical protein [Lysinibacillus sp. OL1_EC]TBV88230.1 hypothetical protein EW028_07260 [Lysinibacillus sp. OL1]